MSFVAYRLFGRIAREWETQLEPFKLVYESSGFEEPFYVYLSKLIAVLVLGAPLVFALSLPFHVLILNIGWVRGVLASIVLAAAYVAGSLGLGLYMPVYLRHARRSRIDASLPYTIGYMASIASAGVGVERLIEEAVEVEEVDDVKRELLLVLRDVKLLGYDTATALTRAASRSPSVNLGIFFMGLRDTYVTSGDLRDYLMFMARRMIEEKTSTLRRVTSSLAVIGEIYVTAMVAAPLMFVVMMVIMSLLGGTVLGVPPLLLIFILTLIVIPSSAIAVIVMIDALLSKV